MLARRPGGREPAGELELHTQVIVVEISVPLVVVGLDQLPRDPRLVGDDLRLVTFREKLRYSWRRSAEKSSLYRRWPILASWRSILAGTAAFLARVLSHLLDLADQLVAVGLGVGAQALARHGHEPHVVEVQVVVQAVAFGSDAQNQVRIGCDCFACLDRLAGRSRGDLSRPR